jgi:hypothetical protein
MKTKINYCLILFFSLFLYTGTAQAGGGHGANPQLNHTEYGACYGKFTVAGNETSAVVEWTNNISTSEVEVYANCGNRRTRMPQATIADDQNDNLVISWGGDSPGSIKKFIENGDITSGNRGEMRITANRVPYVDRDAKCFLADSQSELTQKIKVANIKETCSQCAKCVGECVECVGKCADCVCSKECGILACCCCAVASAIASCCGK